MIPHKRKNHELFVAAVVLDEVAEGDALTSGLLASGIIPPAAAPDAAHLSHLAEPAIDPSRSS